MNSGAVLALILNLFGQPTCINMYRRPGSVVLHYSQLHVLSRVDRNGRIHPGNTTDRIVLGDFLTEPNQPPVCEGGGSRIVNDQFSQHLWRGFASLGSYIAHAAAQ